MNKFARWLLVLGFTALLATTARTHAADKPVDFSAEDKQAEKEDADQMAEREKGIRGKYQRKFLGEFHWLSEPDPKFSPDVVGTFDTNDQDMKPGRHYQVKVENNSKAVLELLKQLDGKNTEFSGKLRVIGQDGEAKYVIVSSVIEVSATPPAVEHSKFGGF